jgi:hypothetical protein
MAAAVAVGGRGIIVGIEASGLEGRHGLICLVVHYFNSTIASIISILSISPLVSFDFVVVVRYSLADVCVLLYGRKMTLSTGK